MTTTTPPPSPFGWRWIRQALALRRPQVAGVLAVTTATYAAGLVFPIALQKGVDAIVAGRAGPDVALLALVAVAAIVIEAGLSFARQGMLIRLATFLDRRISRLMFVQLIRVRIDSARFRAGDAINHFEQARKIRDFILYQLPNLVLDTGGAIVTLALTFYYDVAVGVAILIVTPFLALLARNQLSTANQKATALYAATGVRNNALSETVNGLGTVKALAIESARLRRWESVTQVVLTELAALMRISRSYILRAQIASRAVTLLVVGTGCIRMYQGHISVGDLLALQILSARFAGPILSSGDLYRLWQEVEVAIRQIGMFTALPRETAAQRPPLRTLQDSSIALHNLSFSYPGATRPALAEVTVRLPARGVIALVGRNGSGKSTLMRVLLGLQRDYEGRVEIGGRDLKDYDPRWLRSRIGTVDQDTVLYSGPVRDNLAAGPHLDDAALRKALAFARAEGIVDALPGGLDAEIAENGRPLSGGQRQRLSIARAVLRDPAIALLDEPTAFLDAEAAAELERKLVVWGQERLLILATHHLPAVRNADHVVFLDRGRLLGTGTHQDLLRASAEYDTLWREHETQRSYA
jgi:ABC-type bacteriocin/lantibiotic exporter with double-glycine peptidase domain